ncbi:unnamed protein product [Pylaiella littoralis]
MTLDNTLATTTDNNSNISGGGGGGGRDVDGLNMSSLRLAAESSDGGRFGLLSQGNPFSNLGHHQQQQHHQHHQHQYQHQQQQQQQAPLSLLLANGGMRSQKLEQPQGFGFPSGAGAAAAAGGVGGASVGCCSSCGHGGGGQRLVRGGGGGGRRGPDGAWLDEGGRRLYTEAEVREAIEQEGRAWRDKAASLEAALATMESEAKAALTRADRALAEMAEQLKAAEGKTYALSIHLAQSNRPPHLA